MKLLPLLLLPCALAFGQLPAPNEMGVSMGHHHLNVKDVEESKKFWVELGATPVKIGATEVLKVPGAIIFMRKAEPTGPTDGSGVNHIGFNVRNIDESLAKWKAHSIKVLSENPAARQAMLLSPDGVKVDIIENKSISAPLVSHHIHFAAVNGNETRAWYMKTFGATAGKRGANDVANLPGIELAFIAAPSAPAPTKGRALDHIGFEVKDLEAFTKKLEASGVKFDVPYRKVPALGLSIAFFTDPWGTYVELTEGLTQVQ